MRNLQLPHQRFSRISLGVIAAVAAGCGGGQESSPPVAGQEIAIVATGLWHSAAEGGPSGAHVAISTDDFSKQEPILPTPTSDLSLSSHVNAFYRIERFYGDNIAKFDVADPSKVIWNYKTLDDNETGSSNPYAMVTIDEQKAYVLRYGKRTAWVVRPNATSQADFKSREIDLGAYADGGPMDVPEMASAATVGSRFFVAMQNFDTAYVPQDAYVAVIDTNSDTEIDTDPSIAGAKLGIKLPVKNPQDMTYSSATNLLYVAGTGKYGGFGPPAEYTGGIATINPSTFETRLLVDDGDATTHPYGNIEKVVVVDQQVGYFVGAHSWQNSSVYQFNPTTGVVTASELIGAKGIGCLGVDSKKRLWVCASPGASDTAETKPSMKVYDTSTNELVKSIDLSLRPIDIVFATKPN